MEQTSDDLGRQISAQLNSFAELVGYFGYGSPAVEANGGHHIDKGLQQPRTTLLQAFKGNASFPFGPLTNSKAIVSVPSEGEESEIDITDLIAIGGSQSATTLSSQPGASAQAPQKPASVQEAWS